ncbi:MAG: hypothetical protein GX595_07900, partial [Lentisphaerae bacterium]|nr:hypothetical protein [Lentisphaerota bacterium]
MLCRLLMIAGLLAALAGAQEPAAAPAEGGLLRNPGFDLDADGDGLPDGWSTAANKVRRQEVTYLSGNYEIVSQPNQYVLATQAVELVPGATYTLSLRCRSAGGGLAGVLLLHGDPQPRREMPLLWNLDAPPEYGEYARTFTAPSQRAAIYLYNLARTRGTVAYDRVTLREDGPDRLLISPLTFAPIDRPEGDPPETAHLDWGTPLAGGPLRTCVLLRNLRCLRQVVELGQRLDLDEDVVDTGFDGTLCTSETGHRATRRWDESFYEVFLVASRVKGILAATLRQRVEAGAGLVILEGFGRAADLDLGEGWTTVDDGHALRQGIPWELLPERDLLKAVQTRELGRGRVVRLLFDNTAGRVWGVIPSAVPPEAYRHRQCEYWEWWYALVARSLTWAAQRPLPAALQARPAADNRVAFTIAGAPAGSRAAVVLRSARELRFDGPPHRWGPLEARPDDRGEVTLELPAAMPAGPAIADVRVLGPDGAVLTWGSLAIDRPQSARLLNLTLERAAFAPGDTVRLAAAIAADRPGPARLETSLIDAWGRVVARTAADTALAAGESRLDLALDLRQPLTVHHKAMVRIFQDGLEQDSRWLPLQVPAVGPAMAAEDFMVMPWSPGMTHPAEAAAYSERLREIGLNAEFAASPALMGERAMPGGGYVGGLGMFRETRWLADGVRTQCLSDPAVRAEIRQKTRDAALAQKDHGLVALGIADEAFLASRHQRCEVCFSPHCQSRYREWLQARYGDLDGLNRAWDSVYTAWDQVSGARTEDIRGKANLAPFVDFRQFMTGVWVEACRDVVDACHEVAPDLPVGHTNTFGADPFTGNDYWRLVTEAGFGWGQEYSEAIKASAQKAVFDIWQSFVETPEARRARARPDGTAPAPFFNYGWIGYDRRAAAAHYEPWWLALHGSRGVSWYATNAVDSERGVSWALIHPSLRLTAYSQAARDGLADLRQGYGKLLMEYTPEAPRAALLWSYPSMLVAWCESGTDAVEPDERDGTDSYGTQARAGFFFRQHLDNLQLSAAYVAPDQILHGKALGQYPLLILPFTIAFPTALVEPLIAYVEAGGTLVGDLRCLRTDEHGRPTADSDALQRLFGVTRAGPATYAAGTVRGQDAAAGLDLRGRTLAVYGREALQAAGAQALAAHDTGEPAVLVQRRGAGATVYLNFTLPAYDLGTLDLVEQLTRRAGIARAVRVEP